MPRSPRSGLSVRIDGLSALESIPGAIERAPRQYLDAAGRRLSRQLAQHSPRRTGRLARSWRHVVLDDQRVLIANPLPYARAQDAGAYIQAKGRVLRFRVGGQEVFTRAVRLRGTGYTRKGLRGRGRIVREEFERVMRRLATFQGPG